MTHETSGGSGPAPSPSPRAAAGPKPDNPLISIVFNIALPALILSKLSNEARLGPVYALLFGLSFPLCYGLFDFARRRRANFISVIGFISISLTGSFGLLKLDGLWFAVKEAAIPLLIGTGVVASLWTKTPLVKTILYNDKIIDVARVDRELAARGNIPAFNKLLVVTTWLLACSFVVSASLNFTLATMILKSPSGTAEFNQELGHLTAMSYPIVVVPCMIITMLALWRLLSGIKRLTGLDLEAIFKNQEPNGASGQKP